MGGQAVSFAVGMPSSNGSYALNGQVSLFPLGLVSGNGSFALSGAGTILSIGIVVSNGSYSLSGQTVIFPVALVSAYGSYTLTGQVISFLAPFEGTPILLHAYFFDATLRAPQLAPRTLTRVFGVIGLMDENGNILTDENGVALVATVGNWQSYLLHALPDDFTLTAEQL